jgi:hypothetical protein
MLLALQTGFAVSARKPSFSSSQTNRNSKGLPKSGPQMLNRNYGTKSLPAFMEGAKVFT